MNVYLVHYAVADLDGAIKNIGELVAEIPDKYPLDEGLWLIHADHVTANSLAFSPGCGRVIVTKLTAGESWILGYGDDILNAWLQKRGLL